MLNKKLGEPESRPGPSVESSSQAGDGLDNGGQSNAVVGGKKAVGYFGSGPNSQGMSGQALSDQERTFIEFCQRLGYEPSATFADPDGAVGPDSGYSRLLKYVRETEAGCTVVVPSLDIFRLRPDDLAITILELEKLGARVHVLDGQLVDPLGVVMGTWAQAEKDGDVRERIKSAMRNRAIRGEGLGKPPYGYRIGANRKLEINETEAETVRIIYSLYAQENMGIRLIVRHLNERSIPTRKGRNWSMVTIRDILRNRAYLGTYTRFGMRVPGSHPAIITPDMFRWVQTKLDERKPNRKSGQAEPFLLSGLIYCGDCGNRMVGVTRKQSWIRRKDGSRAERQYRYYQCQSRTNQSVCQYHTRRAKDLEQEVLDYLQRQRSRISGLKGRRSAASTAQLLEKERQRLETAKKNVERRLRQSLQQVSTGKISQQNFRPISTQLIQTRLDLADRLADMQNGANHKEPSLPWGQQAVQSIDKLSAEWEELELPIKRALLQGLLDKIDIFDDRVDIRLRVG
jgi:site-specific DNA recombinase